MDEEHGESAGIVFSPRYVAKHGGVEEKRYSGPPRMVCYARNSTDDQTDKSEPRQHDALMAHARKIGAVPIAFLSDPGRSGRTTYKRPGLEQALRMIEAREAEIFGCETVDRASRSQADAMRLYDRIEAIDGASFHTIDHGACSREVVMLGSYLGQKGVTQQLTLLERGRVRMVGRGLVPHHPSFGYSRDIRFPGLHTIHEERAAFVKEIFDGLDAGLGSTVIARSLTGRVPTPLECVQIDGGRLPEFVRGTWKPHMIKMIASNLIYKGVIVYGKTATIRDIYTREIVQLRKKPCKEWIRIVNRNLRIIEDEQFGRVDERFDARSGPSRLQVKPTSAFLLTGRMRCACGAPVQTTSATSWGAPQVTCTARRLDGETCPGSVCHQVAVIEGAVLEALSESMLHASMVEIFSKEYEATAKATADAERDRRDALLRKLDAAGNAIAALDEGYREGRYPETWHAKRNAELKTEYEEIERHLKDEEAAVAWERGAERLGTASAGMRELIANVPLRGAGRAEREVMETLRAIIADVVIHLPDAEDRVRIEVRADLKSLMGRDLPQDSFFPSADVFEAVYDRSGVAEAAKASRVEARTARRHAEEASGRHRMDEDAWSLVEPLLVADEVGTAELPARRLVDGIWFALRTGAPYNALPAEVYGDSRTFQKRVASLVWNMTFDRMVDLLRERRPEALVGVELARMRTFPRSPYRLAAAGKSETADELRELAAVEPDPMTAKRMRTVADVLDGARHGRAAIDNGTTSISVGRWVKLHEKLGSVGLRHGSSSGKACKLTDAQITRCRELLVKGEDPQVPGRRITMGSLGEFVWRQYNVRYTPGGLADMLAKRGIRYRSCIEEGLRGRGGGENMDEAA